LLLKCVLVSPSPPSMFVTKQDGMHACQAHATCSNPKAITMLYLRPLDPRGGKD
jgi:hypothetical protein